ncbi:MAG TPA: exodeoxyribonuclease VII small subunit [Candidatus Methanoperedens sp.]|nr:exodeoxyribonuclease VII small subunit [Candidatus Methanoperedens sp.]
MAKRKAAAAAQEPSFEAALARLEEIVHELEEADLPLERSLAVFEEGVRLSRLLHQRLNEAERKVEILLKDESGAKAPVPFEAGGETGGARAVADPDEGADGGGGETEGANGGGQRALPF